MEATVKLFPTVDAASTVAILLVKETLFVAPLLLKATAPVNTLFWVKVIGLAPALKLDVPGTVNTPVWVIAPLDATVKLLPTVDAASTVAILLVNDTLLAPLLLKVIAPVKVLALFKVIALTPALKFDVPGTVKTPVCVMAPLEATVKLLPTVDAASTVAILLVKETLLLPLLLKVMAPVKALALFKVIAFAPALKLDVPGTVRTPVCVIAPLEATVKLLPTVEAASTVAILLVKETLLLPLLFKVTAPVKAFALFKVIALAPALKFDNPGTVNIPVWVMAPLEATVKLLPTVDAASMVAILLVNDTLFVAPLSLKVTAPVSTLFWVKVIGLAPALKLDNPGTVNTPV